MAQQALNLYFGRWGVPEAMQDNWTKILATQDEALRVQLSDLMSRIPLVQLLYKWRHQIVLFADAAVLDRVLTALRDKKDTIATTTSCFN